VIRQPVIDSNPPPVRSSSVRPLQDVAAPVRPRPVLVPAAAHDPRHGKAGTLSALQSLLAIIVIAIFIITFCVQPVRIPSASMEPSLLVGDFLFVNKQGSTPGPSSWLLPQSHIQRGQIIVFHYPIDPSINLIKRVIGVPGDHIKLRSGRVYVNDHILTEPYAMYLPSMPNGYRDNFPRLQSADPAVDSRWWIKMHSLIENGELVVPPGDYFVLGDNRNDSEDSRYWGFVPRSAIMGQPFLIYFSLRQPGSDVLDLSHTRSWHHHRSNAVDALADFARWDRTLQIVK